MLCRFKSMVSDFLSSIPAGFRTGSRIRSTSAAGWLEALSGIDAIEVKGPLGSFTWKGHGSITWKSVSRSVSEIGLVCGGSGEP